MTVGRFFDALLHSVISINRALVTLANGVYELAKCYGKVVRYGFAISGATLGSVIASHYNIVEMFNYALDRLLMIGTLQSSAGSNGQADMLAEYYTLANFFFPVSECFTMLSILTSVVLTVQAVRFIMWVIKKISEAVEMGAKLAAM